MEKIYIKKPWGYFRQYTLNEISTVKILTVNPGQRLSLQSHQYREELWVALNDGLVVEIDGLERILQKGEEVFIPKLSKHRLSSKIERASVLEISFGYFDENDITRYEDYFNRV